MTGSSCDLKFYCIILTLTWKEREKERSHDKGIRLEIRNGCLQNNNQKSPTALT